MDTDIISRVTQPSLLQFVADFIVKQVRACIFGISLLLLIALTYRFYPHGGGFSRFDFLTLMAIALQFLFLATKVESMREIGTIFIFHLLGTGLELFKTEVGSWSYPQDGVLYIFNVPLFAGFMYASVGSYFLRLNHLFKLKFSHFPSRILLMILAIAAYGNFMTHHFMVDLRWWIFWASILLFCRTWVYFEVVGRYYRMPLLIALGLIALLIWIAENISTFYAIWLYPEQLKVWKMVSTQKIVAWYLLMLSTLSLILWIYPPQAITQYRANIKELMAERDRERNGGREIAKECFD